MHTEVVHLSGEDGVVLRGTMYVPNGSHPRPAITMAHGFAATCAHSLHRFAQGFADAGFAVLMHDHRGFGMSDGERGDVDPWRQVADWRHAITFLETHPAVDPGRIGLWGSSFAGGHALVLGATDRRLNAIVAQVPTISGYEQSRRRVHPDEAATLEHRFLADDRERHAGRPGAVQAVVSAADDHPAIYRCPDARAFYLQDLGGAPSWDNAVTLRSSRAARMYEPGNWVSRISPTPLLMVVALHDTVTLTDVELAAYNSALPPKQLVTLPGGHFDVYGRSFTEACGAAIDWFAEHLSK